LHSICSPCEPTTLATSAGVIFLYVSDDSKGGIAPPITVRIQAGGVGGGVCRMTSNAQSARRLRTSRLLLGFVGAVLASCLIGVTIVVVLGRLHPRTAAQVTIEGCRSYDGSIPSAMVSIQNQTTVASTFYVEIGFDQGGRQFGTGALRERLPAGPLGLWIGFIPAHSYPPGTGALACTVLQVADQG
jgi:hypothetical protein